MSNGIIMVSLHHGDVIMTEILMMSDVLYSGRKSQSFQLRLPARMKEEIRRVAEMDGISINSAIVQRLAKSLREERANAQ